MKTGILLVYILESLGVDSGVIKVIMIFYLLAIIILVVGFIASIFNTAQYTKKIMLQNELIIKYLYRQEQRENERVNEKLKEIEKYNKSVYDNHN